MTFKKIARGRLAMLFASKIFLLSVILRRRLVRELVRETILNWDEFENKNALLIY